MMITQYDKRNGFKCNNPDNKIHGAIMGPTWVLSAPGGPHVGPKGILLILTYWCHLGHFLDNVIPHTMGQLYIASMVSLL